MSQPVSASQQPLVSVLTPVYNGERYLAECIESVLSQTYQNWEYIIVNNCSTDRTLEIATEYTRRDSRIRIVNNKEFVSASRNHNLALTMISPVSKYCKFVQADDLIFPACLSEMVQVAETHPSVGMVGSYELHGSWVHCDGLPFPSTVVQGRDVCRTFFLKRLSPFGTMSGILLRADLVRSRTPFLNEQFLFNDWDIYFRVLQNHALGFVHQVLSLWRIHEEALSSFAERHNQGHVAELYFIKQYGDVYLSPEEYERCLRESLNRYYRCQGHEFFRLREKSYWQYHHKMMKEIGLSFSDQLLLQGAVSEAFDILFEPFKAALRSVKHIRKGPSSTQRAQGPKRQRFPLTT